MYLTCVRHKVKDFQQWKNAFDINAELLFEKNGVLSTTIVQVDGNPLDIAIINTWKSKKHWDDFGAAHDAPEMKGKVKTPEEGGVVGEITFFGGEVA